MKVYKKSISSSQWPWFKLEKHYVFSSDTLTCAYASTE